MFDDFIVFSVTFLPEDRLSQVTRRGMLTYTKNHNKPHTAVQSELSGYQRRTGVNQSFSGRTAVGRGTQREPSNVEDREEADHSDLNRLQDLEVSESNRVRITISSVSPLL